MPRIAARLCVLLVAACLTGANSSAAEAAEAAETAADTEQTPDTRMPDATADTDEDAQTQASPRNQPPAPKPQSGASRSPSSDDVFRPSEEISEDLAVSYPADI